MCYSFRCCGREGKGIILSRQTSELLTILEIEISSVSEENLLREFDGIFAGVGKLRDFHAKLYVDETVQPIARELRPSPFGLSKKSEQKLEELVSHDIIEPVEGSTPWVSCVVIVPKPSSGDIKLCVDKRKAKHTSSC